MINTNPNNTNPNNTNPNNTNENENENENNTNPFYKVNYLVNNNIENIFVFYGKKIVPQDKMTIVQKIFTEEEIRYMDQNNIIPEFLEEQIHFDDTIGTIKLKILEHFKNKACFE